MPKKLKSRKGLIRDLDKMVGDVAKAAFRKEFGDYCIFCDLRGKPREPINQAFHYFSRKRYKTRWILINLGASCPGCNIAYEQDAGFVVKVADWYKDKFGFDAWEELEKLWHSPVEPISTVWLRELHEKVKQEMGEV